MKRSFIFVLLILVFTSSISFISAAENNSTTDTLKIKDINPQIGQNINETATRTIQKVDGFAERLGLFILKFQEIFMGALSYISLGVMAKGGHLALAQFLFFILVFMCIYSVTSMIPIFSKYGWFFTLIVSFLAVFFLDAGEIEAILTTYEALGVVFSVILPLVIISLFSYRIYAKAHYGKGEKSPFYANLFNMFFLIFFGVFFIQFSNSEEGGLGFARKVGGYFLIILGVLQFLLFKKIANIIMDMKSNAKREYKEELDKRDREIKESNIKASQNLPKLAEEQENEMKRIILPSDLNKSSGKKLIIPGESKPSSGGKIIIP